MQFKDWTLLGNECIKRDYKSTSETMEVAVRARLHDFKKIRYNDTLSMALFQLLHVRVLISGRIYIFY